MDIEGSCSSTGREPLSAWNILLVKNAFVYLRPWAMLDSLC